MYAGHIACYRLVSHSEYAHGAYRWTHRHQTVTFCVPLDMTTSVIIYLLK